MAGLSIETSLLYKNTLYSDASTGMQALQRDFEASARRIQPMLAQELLRHLQLVAQQLAEKHSGAWPGGTTATTLSRRSGEAMESLKKGVKIQQGTSGVEGTMSGVFYLTIHEYGGTIRATKAQYLTIPLPAALNSNGTPKKRSAREWNNTFVGQSKAGNLIIFQRNGRLITPLYVLKKSVKIRARLGLRKAQEDAMDLFVNRVARFVAEDIMG